VRWSEEPLMPRLHRIVAKDFSGIAGNRSEYRCLGEAAALS